MNSIWFQISALVFLGWYLLFKHQERIEAARQAEALRRTAGGKALEATALLLTMKTAREERLHLARQPRRASAAHREFAAQVGKSLRRLTFFSSQTTAPAASVTDEHPA